MADVGRPIDWVKTISTIKLANPRICQLTVIEILEILSNALHICTLAIQKKGDHFNISCNHLVRHPIICNLPWPHFFQFLNTSLIFGDVHEVS